MIDKTAFVAAQLRAISPGVEWTISGVDRADELARILVRANVLDLWALKFVPVKWVEHIDAWVEEFESRVEYHDAQDIERDGYAFDYYGRRIGFLGTPTRQDNDPVLKQVDRGLIIAWSAEGHGHVGYFVSKNARTNALQFQPQWDSSSDAAFIRSTAIMFISFFVFTALPMAGISVGNAIGAAVLPAGVPAVVATTVGNVALSAALSGGDIKGAVKNALVGAVSGGVGNAAQLVSESALIGSLASAAAQAAITGDSIAEAVGIAALRHGASNVDDFFELTSDPIFSPGFNGTTPEFSFDWNGQEITVAPVEFDKQIPLPTPIQADFFQFSNEPVDTDLQIAWDPVNWNPFDDPVLTQTPANVVSTVPTVTPPKDSPTWNPSTIVQGVSTAALAAINLIKAYRSLDTPVIQTTARSANAAGAVSVVGNNGLIQTRAANGSITVGKPPVGVPQATPNGNFVVNNGDGTYTVVAPDGARQTLRYADSSGLFGDISPTMIAAGVGLLFIAMRK